MVDAVKKHSSAEVVMSLGVPTVLSDDTSGIAAAVEMAKGADEVILAVGTDLSWVSRHDNYRWDLGCTLLKTPAISLLTGA